jgi:hypothetical protein
MGNSEVNIPTLRPGTKAGGKASTASKSGTSASVAGGSRGGKGSMDPLPVEGEQPEATFWQRPGVLAAVAAVVLMVVGVSLWRTYRYVDRNVVTSDQPPLVRLVDPPSWMSQHLQERIAAAARPTRAASAYDQTLLKDVYNALTTSPGIAPWIVEVRQVRRLYATGPGDLIEIDAQYRTPAALVRWTDSQGQDGYWLIDSHGVKLPERFNADQVPLVILDAAGKMNLRIIEGVAASPSPAGATWQGEDLKAGLEMVKLLAGQSYADEILKVDVSNYNARLDSRTAHLSLITRHGTRLLWGRPAGADDFFVEASPAKKIEHLKEIVRVYGRVDAGKPWIDLRFDRVLQPASAPTIQPEARPASASISNRE